MRLVTLGLVGLLSLPVQASIPRNQLSTYMKDDDVEEEYDRLADAVTRPIEYQLQGEPFAVPEGFRELRETGKTYFKQESATTITGCNGDILQVRYEATELADDYASFSVLLTEAAVWGIAYERRNGEVGILINTRNQGFDKRILHGTLRCDDMPAWVLEKNKRTN